MDSLSRVGRVVPPQDGSSHLHCDKLVISIRYSVCIGIVRRASKEWDHEHHGVPSVSIVHKLNLDQNTALHSLVT